MTDEERISVLPEENQRVLRRLMANKPEDLPENPQKNTWYIYRPQGCFCSDGEAYYSTLKIGLENKLLIMFCGGGFAVDLYTAARPAKLVSDEGKVTFYQPNTAVIGYLTGKSGLTNKDREENPFKDWSVVVISYASGDFHCGTNDVVYDDGEMGQGVCHQRGYINYRAMLDKMKTLIPDPQQVFITGYSAGGFGAALLSDDIIKNFDKCDSFYCLVDSAFLAYQGWRETTQYQWKAPKEIHERLVSDNITVDALLALHRSHGIKVKIAITCTSRDALLSQDQNYFKGKGMIFDQEGGDIAQNVIKQSVVTLSQAIPNLAVYIYDRPHGEIKEGNLTEHTIIASDDVFEYEYQGVKIIDWINAFYLGNPYKIGLHLLEL